MALRSDTRSLDRGLLVFCLAVLCAAVLYPAVRLFVEAAGSWDGGALTHGAGFAAIRNTFMISLGSVLCAGLVDISCLFQQADER